MRTAFRLLAIPLLLAASGCVTTGALEGRWIEASSANFSIYTTLDEPDARELLENLELFRAAILAVTNVRSVNPHVPTEIYAFRSEREYQPFQPRENTAGFFRPTLRVNIVALSAGARTAAARATLYHEYTHFLVQNEGFAHYPIWFDEGFADLLSSIDVRGGNVRIGLPPAQRVSWLQYGSAVPYSRVIRARGYEGWSPDDLAMFYAQSWLLVHYLMLGRGTDFTPQLRHYVESVSRRVDPERAFRESFGIEVGDLAQRLKKYEAKVPTFGISRAKLAPELAVSVRAVASDEIDTRLGWVALSGAKTDLARRHFESAISANPNNARAIAGIADTHKFDRRWVEAEAAYRRSLELAPGDWQNHLELAEYLLDRADAEEEQRAERLASAREHLRRAIELAPEIPEGHAILGMVYATDGESLDLGIASLERARALLPSHPAIEYPLAQLHHRAGHRERAIELLRRVVHQPHGDANREAAELLAQLEGHAGEEVD